MPSVTLPRAIAVVAFAVVTVLGRPTHALAIPVSYFDESGCTGGDAGDSLSDPCFVNGGPYNGFSGNVGDGDDTLDVFAFYFAGGSFGATNSVSDVAYMQLYDYATQT